MRFASVLRDGQPAGVLVEDDIAIPLADVAELGAHTTNDVLSDPPRRAGGDHDGPAAPTDPRELAGILYHHPERQPPGVAPSEAVASKQRALVDRLIGPPRDPELEAAMRELQIPTLVMFGTEDRLTPPELGRHYRDLLPHCHLVIVYDAAHAIDCDRPEAFAALVSDFLEHHEQFVVRRQSGLLYS
jgi:pimeloyl-ACP methyl ester carboxylesterase